MNNQVEKRVTTRPVELREADDGTVSVSGYAAVFDQEARIGELFREVIRPGAFKRAIDEGDDVVFLVNHGGLPLARTRSGTLKLTEDERGLKIDADLDMSDPDVRQILPKMKRGDLDKMSFAFWPTRDVWDESDQNDIPLREIEEVQLVDVAIVTTPAYEGTAIGLRALERYRSQNSGNVARRARLKSRLTAIGERK